MKHADFTLQLHELRNANLYRHMRTLSTAQEREIILDNKQVLLFSSNNYLGFSREAFLQESILNAVNLYGIGSGGSRLTTGNSTLHMQLESAIAMLKKTESCLTFTSGYTANVGTISSIGTAESIIFSDALNHASIIDGCRLARAKTVIYAHNDIDDLRNKIREYKPQKGLVISDSVFSMDGDIAPVQELAQLCHEYKLLLMIDDAHATGVLGKTGGGSLEYFGLKSQDVDILLGTLSKALASEGGFICAAEDICTYVRHTARSFIYTTAPSPATIATSLATIEHIHTHPERVLQLQKNIRYFADGLKELGLAANAQTPIFPIIIGAEEQALRISEEFLQQNIFVPCIRYPTVAKGQARLRITLMATHTQQDMEYVLYVLRNCMHKYGILSAR